MTRTWSKSQKMRNNNYGIYVHIPFCKARCGYCAFSSCCDYTLQQAYFDKLLAEIEARAKYDVRISTVYLGGGTPSSVDTKYLDMLFSKLAECFDLSQVAETTVECNPESVTDELLSCLARHNVNRLSFGLQSANDDTLRRIGRIHRYADFVNAVNLARARGFTDINADLIVGLPETVDSFYNSVAAVVKLPLSHVSVYALELHEHSPIYKLCKDNYDYDDDMFADMYDYAVATLNSHGFARYEVSNFAKCGCESKHNLNYWDEGRYFAFGAAASGFIGDVRYTNPFDVEDYIATPLDKLLEAGDTLTLDEQANEYAMLRLRLRDGVDLAEFTRRYNADFFTFFPNADKLVADGFLAVTDGSVAVPPSKLYVLNSILCNLLTL